MGLKKGDIVSHKLTGQRMMVKRSSKTIATLELIDEPMDQWSHKKKKFHYRTAICQIENLLDVHNSGTISIVKK